jgi:hypothetical protein
MGINTMKNGNSIELSYNLSSFIITLHSTLYSTLYSTLHFTLHTTLYSSLAAAPCAAEHERSKARGGCVARDARSGVSGIRCA